LNVGDHSIQPGGNYQIKILTNLTGTAVLHTELKICSVRRIKINGQDVEWNRCIEYLGVTFDLNSHFTNMAQIFKVMQE